MVVLTDLRNRGVADVFFVVCDGLKGLPNSVNTVWPMSTVQMCIIHLVRGSFRYASRKYWDELSKDLLPIYTAKGADATAAALETWEDEGVSGYPAMIRLCATPGATSRSATSFARPRHRDFERPISQGGQGLRTLPDRTGRDEVPVPGHQVPGPERYRSNTVGRTVETSPERVRHHLRRPHARGRGSI